VRGEIDQGGDFPGRRAIEADLQDGLIVPSSSLAVPRSGSRPAPSFGFRQWTEREAVFSWLMVAPPTLFLLALVGYPFVYGILLSLEHRPVAQPGTFVGLANFITDLHDPTFWQVAQNTFVYTFFATVIKMIGGLALALVMNQDFRFKNTVRALVLLPFIVPTVLSTIAWMWLLDPAFAPINWFLRYFHIANPGPSWLGNPHLAMMSLIIVNVWRGLPFYAITLLAGLQTISPELYEAATIDGATTWDRFRYVTLPLLKPVIFIVTMFSVIFTFADFQLVYVLTRGGPANATHLFATYAFDVAMSGGQFGVGASIALAMLPPLALIIIAMSFYMKPRKS
jgi:multiple sugar transport system permease protein